MKILIELFELILLKRRPQDISFDLSAAVIAVMATVAASYFSLVTANTFSKPLSFVLTQVATQAVIFYLLLVINGKQIRYIQTITALFGVSAILQFVGLIILQLPTLALFGIILSAWNLYLMVLILRDAIDCSTIQSIIITIIYHFVIGLILFMLFPEIFEKMQKTILEAQSAS